MDSGDGVVPVGDGRVEESVVSDLGTGPGGHAELSEVGGEGLVNRVHLVGDAGAGPGDEAPGPVGLGHADSGNCFYINVYFKVSIILLLSCRFV